MFISIFIVIFLSVSTDAKSVNTQFHSDVIVTKWPENKNETEEAGWMRRQLTKFGQIIGRVGNAMGEHATKITTIVEKICSIVRTIVPFLAAVCHVGQFDFCETTAEFPTQMDEALKPDTLNLDVLDRRR